MLDGLGCSDVCAPGYTRCGGECLLGDNESVCCIGPMGRGMACDPGAQCCHGVCEVNGTDCAKTCAPEMIHCGGRCMLGNSSSTCCLGPTGKGIVCGPDAVCCDGICVADGTGCDSDCAPGLAWCGGACLPLSDDSTCCVGPSGRGIICGPDAQCCDGFCMPHGKGCSTDAQPQAALPPAQQEKINELLVSEKTCGNGYVRCAGECLAGAATSTCCPQPDGKGLLCGPSPDCCEGLSALAQMSKTNYVV